ncbi:hypothetical protein QZH41_016801 [Actinostola sp. cb2023]|nr:hypothetical protein QZH41_016801 [Actinostola sp. cb2023]
MHDGISSWNLTKEDGKPCSHNCLITYNKCDLARSDAVVFHGVDIPSAQALRWIAYLQRNHRQRWVYFTHENPYNVGHDTAPYNGIFNWTVSYRRDSDVFYPDGYFREIETAKDIPKDHSSTNYANGKDKLIAWAVSHCGRLRDKVVHKLLKFVPVTVFGGGVTRECREILMRRGRNHPYAMLVLNKRARDKQTAVGLCDVMQSTH